jgi:hypothetical protein
MLLVGPSGSSKTTVADALDAGHGIHHLNADDRSIHPRPFHVYAIEDQWPQFYAECDARPLASRLEEIAAEKGKQGVVITLSPNNPKRLLSPEHVRVASKGGIGTVVLWGPKDLCREAALSRGPIPPDWDESQEPTFAMYGRSEFAPNRIEVFSDGEQRPVEVVVQDVLGLIA